MPASVALQPELIGDPAPEPRILGRISLVPELEVLGVEDAGRHEALPHLKPAGPDDVGHGRGLDPDLGRDPGEQMRRGHPESCLPRPLVTAAPTPGAEVKK